MDWLKYNSAVESVTWLIVWKYTLYVETYAVYNCAKLYNQQYILPVATMLQLKYPNVRLRSTTGNPIDYT